MSPSGVPSAALATLCHEPFFTDGWIYERKLDGERCLAVRDASGVRLMSRSGRDISGSFPEIADALTDHATPTGIRTAAPGLVVDGEVVAFEGSRTSFARLQPRIQVNDPDRARNSGVRVFYYIFDLLGAAEDDLRSMPLLERKRRLRAAVRFGDPLRYTPHRVRADHSYFTDVCGRGWEGLIAKRADAPYRAGRSDAWLKFKCEAGQEFIIVGFTDPAGSRIGLGALLLGFYAGHDLVYAGKVGTGFSESALRDLCDRLSALEIPGPTCTRGQLPRAGVHWVHPELVAQVAFTEWTRAGQLRHPRYLGLRRDKRPDEVVRE